MKVGATSVVAPIFLHHVLEFFDFYVAEPDLVAVVL